MKKPARLSGDPPSATFSPPDDVFQLVVTIVDIEPRIWRRLLVPQDLTLPQVHTVLQTALGWTNSHLHQFKVGDIRFAEPNDEDEPAPIDYRRLTLNQIAPHRGSTFIYEYDFGDGWEHLIEIEDELPVEGLTVTLPSCVGGKRACPPEDCGGPSGYAEFLEAIRDPRHPEHDGYLEWVGTQFDPEAFDLARVNQILAGGARRPPARPRAHPRRRRSP